jgi:hypothetical protein
VGKLAVLIQDHSQIIRSRSDTRFQTDHIHPRISICISTARLFIIRPRNPIARPNQTTQRIYSAAVAESVPLL